MKKTLTLWLATILAAGGSFASMAYGDEFFERHCQGYPAHYDIPYNAVQDIPDVDDMDPRWQKVEDVAQYKLADWSNALFRAHKISLLEAKALAEKDPRVTYFFYVTHHLVLENREVSPTMWRIFNSGDAVFFSGEPWWGSSGGRADGYIKSSDE
jgi:hypothetical protein